MYLDDVPLLWYLTRIVRKAHDLTLFTYTAEKRKKCTLLIHTFSHALKFQYAVKVSLLVTMVARRINKNKCHHRLRFRTNVVPFFFTEK